MVLALSGLLALLSLPAFASGEPPEAVPDEYMKYVTASPAPLVIAAVDGVLANDEDPEGDPLSVELAAVPNQGGTVTLETDGSFRYTPAPTFGGTEEFSYRVSDGSSVVETVARIEVRPPGSPPTPLATNDTYVTYNGGTRLVVPFPGVLLNDEDAPSSERHLLSTRLVTPATHGQFTLSMLGGFRYKPAASFVGTDSFIYEVTDGSTVSNPGARVTLHVLKKGTGTRPLGVPDQYIAYQGTDLIVSNAQGVLANDVNEEEDAGDTLTAVLIEAPEEGGTVQLDPFGGFTYTPSPGFGGTYQFTYQVTDGNTSSEEPIAVRIEVVQPGTAPPPHATDDAYVTYNGGTVLSVPRPGVLANDIDDHDPQQLGDTLSTHLLTNVAHGKLVLAARGEFQYKAAHDFTGVDRFVYLASDGSPQNPFSNPAQATIQVLKRGGGAAPVGREDHYLAFEHTPLAVMTRGVLGNDSDAEDDTLTAILETSTTKGTLRLDPFGGFTYQPGAAGPDDHFTYRVTDGTSITDPILVTIAVIAPGTPPPPTARDDAYVTYNGDAVLEVADPGVLSNDTDPARDPMAAHLRANPLHGRLGLSGYGGFRYQADADFEGEDHFTYEASDGAGFSNPANVAIRVLKQGGGETPTPNNDAYVAHRNVPLVVLVPGVLANDTDPDSDAMTAILVSGPANGTLKLDPLGGFTYLSRADFTGTDEFTYRVTDGKTTSLTFATVQIQVSDDPENQAPLAVTDT